MQNCLITYRRRSAATINNNLDQYSFVSFDRIVIININCISDH